MTLRRQAVRFGCGGAVNTAVGLACIFAAMALGADEVTANMAGYGVGLGLSFTLNRRWTFESDGRAGMQLLRFLAAFVIAYCTNLGSVLLLRDVVGVNAYIAQACGVVPYTIVFFLLSRYFVFAEGMR
ncbi:MAG: GtrA family protein [Sutterellaceae bacterium]|nr:GtrA family protein [Burkholderiaceae bacterium]MDW8429690.1 GtrA family protein [Sutterellaceae bacterium]